MRLLSDRGRPLILDGGWATELQRLGLALGESADAWNLSRPDDVLDVARSYVKAGADAILTNTFQANAVSLARFGLADQARRINVEGARLSRRAAAPNVLVFGSIGPIGPGGGTDGYALQARALADGGVDGIALETFVHVEDARLAVREARKVDLPVVASFYFDTSSGDPLTPGGSSPEDVARAMADEGVDAVGANCGAGPAEFVAICRRLSAVVGRGVWIKPNAGLPTIRGGRAVYPTSPEDLAAFLPEYVEAGAGYVGGCCGATPDFIRALRRASQEDLS